MRKHKRFLLLNTLVWCLIGAMHFALLGTLESSLESLEAVSICSITRNE